MALEIGTFISNLVVSNPVGSIDSRRAGDDHLRLIKTVLQTTFPEFDQTQAKMKINGSAAPTVANDSSQGFRPGSHWIDTANQKEYTCMNNAVGAAVWKLVVAVAVDGSGGLVTSGMHMMFFQASTTMMTGWTFQAKDQDYVISPGATNAVGGTTVGAPDDSGWAPTGLVTTGSTVLTGNQSGTGAHRHFAFVSGIVSGSVLNSASQSAMVGESVGEAADLKYKIVASNSDPNVGFTSQNTAASAIEGHTHAIGGFSGVWRPPRMFGTIWSKD